MSQYENPAQKATILIQGVEVAVQQYGTRYAIKTDSGKYVFYDKKKDGSETTAMKQFRELGIAPGMSVEVGYSATDKVFSQNGVDKPYVEKRILFFSTGDAPAPRATNTGGMQAIGGSIEARVAQLEKESREHGQDIDRINEVLQSLSPNASRQDDDGITIVSPF